MRLLLVDDEPLARLRLRTLIEGAGGIQGIAAAAPGLALQIAGEAGDADEALALLRRVQADVLLLDIRMPGVTASASPLQGLRLADRLRALPQPPLVVFVTAYEEHALKAFEVDAVDYLTKPVRSERLHAALQRAHERLGQRTRSAAGAGAAAHGPVLVVNDRGRVLRLPLPEVLYLKAEQKYVTLRTATHALLLDESLAELELRLTELGGSFLRVHRNALVSRQAIRALALRRGAVGARAAGDDAAAADPAEAGDGNDGWAVRVAPLDEWLAVSRRQVAAVRAALAAG